MLNLDETKAKKNELFSAVSAALASGNEEQIKAAVMDLQEFNKNELKAIYNEYEQNRDEAVLEARGIKALTSEETKFWNQVIDDARMRFRNSASDGVYTGITDLLPKTEYPDLSNANNLSNTSKTMKVHDKPRRIEIL